MNNYINKVAAGLRRMTIPPDSFLFCDETDTTWDELRIIGIPVFHSALIHNTYTDLDIPFIPMWISEGDYIIQRNLFNLGYTE